MFRDEEVIIIDDGSTDSTSRVAEESGATLYQHEENMGKVRAIMTGISKARGKTIVLIDADYTYPAADIPRLLAEIDKGADLVIGSRFLGRIEKMPYLNRIGNRLFSLAASLASGREITDAQSGFRAFRTDLLDKLEIRAKGLEFETEMTVKAAKRGFKVVEIPINYRHRLGRSKLNPLSDGFRMGRSIAKITIEETSPLARSILGAALFFLVLGAYTGSISFLDYLKLGLVTHEYYPILTVLFLLFSAQSCATALLLDHISKRLDRIEEFSRK